MSNRRMVLGLKREEDGVCHQHLPPPLRQQRQLVRGLEVQVVNGVAQVQGSGVRQMPQEVGAEAQMLDHGRVVRLQGGGAQVNKPMDGMYSRRDHCRLCYSLISLQLLQKHVYFP